MFSELRDGDLFRFMASWGPGPTVFRKVSAKSYAFDDGTEIRELVIDPGTVEVSPVLREGT